MKACAILNTISEFVLGVFPIIGVYKLNVDRTQRRTVIGLLSLGFLVGFAGCFRTYFLWQSVSAPDLDLSWWADPHWIASEIEIDLAIVCACVAPLRPLVTYAIRKLRGQPSQSPTVRGKRPSLSTHASKRSEMDYDFKAGWVAPRPQYFDLEGLPCDGYGYTVVISGPARKRNRLRRRKSIQETDSHQAVLQRPGPSRESVGSRVSQRASEYAKGANMDIATVKEINVHQSVNWSRINRDKFQPLGTHSTTSDDIELNRKTGRSWLSEV